MPLTKDGRNAGQRAGRLAHGTGARFVAIDFETADHLPDSACALGLVKVEEGRVVSRAYRLIRPPRPSFAFTWLHGIGWEHVRHEPTFGTVWKDLSVLLEGADFIAAHNAPFDRGVLRACCAAAGLAPPELKFECTVQVARRTWGIYPTKLDHVCRALGIPLQHHHAASDAEACARIMIAAAQAEPRPQTAARPRAGRKNL